MARSSSKIVTVGLRASARGIKAWLVIAALAPVLALATPQVVRMDGMLYDTSGNALTGVTGTVQVSAFAASTGGSALWTSSSYSVIPSNGKFTVDLDTSVSGGLETQIASLASTSPLWFEISYNASIVRPRVRARGTMFAVSSASADTLAGVTTTAAQLNYVAGVTANVQTQLNSISSGKQATLTTGNVSANTAQVSLTGVTAGAVIGSGFGITVSTATTSATGLLTSTDWNTFNNKQAAFTAGAISSSTTGVTIGNGSGSVVGTGVTITIATATTSASGILTTTDWNTFNNKAAALGYTPVNKAGDTMSNTLTLSSGNVALSSGNVALTSGQIYSASHTLAGATANFATGNVQVLSAVGGPAITLTGLQDGGAYTVIVTDTTARPYTFAGCTPALSPTFPGSTGRTVFSILYLATATTCFITWVTGF